MRQSSCPRITASNLSKISPAGHTDTAIAVSQRRDEEVDAYNRASASRAASRGERPKLSICGGMGGSQIFRQNANAETARHCQQRTTRQLQRETATFQSILCGETPQIRKTGESLQLDREDLRLVDQVQLKLQRGDLVGDGAVVCLRLGNVVVRVPILDGPVAATEVPVA